MESDRAPSSPLVRQALLAAAVMMAWNVAAKTTRDSLFLSAFPATALPAMMGGAAVSSILMAVLNVVLLRRFGPSRIVRFGFLTGMALHAAEWALLPRAPRLVAIAVYIHVVALGSVLLSGFWALANEQFNPREARRSFGRIAAFGTLGTVVGGLMTERVASLTSPHSLLVLLAILQLACAIAISRFKPASQARRLSDDLSFPEVISGAGYLTGLAGLVLLAAMSASTLDYLFKAQAVAQFGKGAHLSRFFALFYTTTSTFVFGIQMGGSRMWLKHFGPGRTVAALPVAVTGASLAAIFAPGMIALTAGRAIELLLRGSLYRSGYELFYTPMPQAEKRSVKSIIDIGAERLGDGLAGAGIQLLLTLPAQAVSIAILALTAALSATGVWLALRLDRVYVKVLEKGMADYDPGTAAESTTDLNLEGMLSKSVVITPGAAPSSARPPNDPALGNLSDMGSADPVRITAALMGTRSLASAEVPLVIDLLDRDDVAQAAYLALKKSGDRISGQLVDALKNLENPFNVRKRIPKILSSCQSRAAWDGLAAHLLDERFEVRTRCAKALEKILARRPEFRPDRDTIVDVVRQELVMTRSFSRKGLDPAMGVDKAFKDRAARSLEHIFTLLGLVFPRESLQLAFRALRTEGGKQNGVALEYLNSVLPRALREELTAHLEGSTRSAPVLTTEEAAKLVDDNPSVMHRLEYWTGPENPSNKK